MADVKWIKIVTDIFNNRKIRQIESLPDGDSIIVIWVKLLCLAGNVNDNGYIYFTKEIPYTEQMLANQFNRPLATVQLALKTFEQFGMVEIINNILCISNWEKYQNIEGLDKIREQTRTRVARHRELKKLKCNVTCNATVTQSNAIDIDKEKEKEREEENTTPLPPSKGKETPEEMFNRLSEGRNLSEPLKDKLKEWLQYKKERKEGYKETGLKSFLTRIEKDEQVYGSSALIDCIDLCMARGYRGIITDLIGEKKQSIADQWKDVVL